MFWLGYYDLVTAFVPEELQVEMLALTGKAIERDVLTAVEVIPKNEMQEHVWSKYKKDVKYQWYKTFISYLHDLVLCLFLFFHFFGNRY